MKLEIKHLAPYLPYSLKIFEPVQQKGLILDTVMTTYSRTRVGLPFLLENGVYKIEYGLPILRPMSDIGKSIEHNGEVFVPLEWLTEKTYIKSFDEMMGIVDYRFLDFLDYYTVVVKLFEWHFDVFGLIEKDLAIDINTIQ